MQYLDVVRNAAYECLRYPLLFPAGDRGWFAGMNLGDCEKLSQIDYYRMLMMRE